MYNSDWYHNVWIYYHSYKISYTTFHILIHLQYLLNCTLTDNFIKMTPYINIINVPQGSSGNFHIEIP